MRDRSSDSPPLQGPLDRLDGLASDQALSDADQDLSEADQLSSDRDQTWSESDAALAHTDEQSSERDQASADRDHAGQANTTPAGELAFAASREERRAASLQRHAVDVERTGTARDRDTAADQRDGRALTRDGVARDRGVDVEAAGAVVSSQAQVLEELRTLQAQAAADRAKAAADRAQAAEDRRAAAAERDRLKAELRKAHLDALTGAFGRELGEQLLSREVDRARRSDGRLVVAFVDVDGLKAVNDNQGHAAGDEVLRRVVSTMRSQLRSFDNVIRYGGDEFVCALSGSGIDDARRRFELISGAIQTSAGVSISVGLAALTGDETAVDLTNRADKAMLSVKARHHAA